MRALQISLVLFSISIAVPRCYAQPASVQAKHARVELIATSPHKETLLGIHFILERGWHIYWINPGDSGQPPSFNWQLPAGAAAGEVLWPRPERLQSSPEIADYGYKDDVLLTVPLRLGTAKPASRFEVKVDARWLICREVCLPDHAQLSLLLPAEPGTHITELFARTKKLLPQPWPEEWKAAAESRKDDFLLTVMTGKSVSSAEFFPLDPGQIENAAKQRVQTTPTGAKLILKKSDLLVKPLPQLRGVLVIAGRAYQMRAPLITQVAVK